MNPSDDFWRNLRELQDAELAHSEATRRLRLPLSDRVGTRSMRKYWAVALLAGVLVGALAAVLWVNQGGRAGPAPFTFSIGERGAGQVGEWIAANDETALPLEFSDGTRIVLAPSARARVASLGGGGARLVVERGSLNAESVHRAGSPWRIDVGPFQVDVMGSHFQLDWEPALERLELSLSRGSVSVAGAFLRQPVLVAAGQTLRASELEQRAELSGIGRAQPDFHELAAPDVGPRDKPAEAHPSSLASAHEPAQ